MNDLYSSQKPKNIRQYNQKLVLSLLQLSDEISISELSEKTNLSKTTISKMFIDFCQSGILLSVGKGESSSDGGKKPELFALNPEYRYTIVLSFVQTGQIVCSLVDLMYRVQHTITNFFEADISYEGLVKQILQAITDILQASGVHPSKLMGIAVACNGIINTNTGILLYPAQSSLGTHLPLRQDIMDGLPFPAEVFLDTAHRFSAYAELLFEENQKYHSLIVISNKHAVGASILAKQKLVPGYDGVVGDFSHIIIDPNSPIRCSCGRHGCLATLVSEDTVLNRAAQGWQQFPFSSTSQKFLAGSLSLQDIFAASNQEDPFAQQLVDYLVDVFSILLHNLISVNSAKRIVLQGFFAAEGNYFLKNLREKVFNFNRFHLCGNIEIDYSLLDLSPEYAHQESYLLGANFYVSNHYFDKFVF